MIKNNEYHQIHSNEYYNLQNMYGTNWINMLLGNLSSYKHLRELHTYSSINTSIQDLEVLQ
jgi:hypothetical protein